MINLHTDILDNLNAKQLFLACQIARHIGAKGIAWPSLRRLAKLTGWSPTTVKKIRAQLIEKGAVKIIHRKDELGKDLSPIYALCTPQIGVFLGADKLAGIGGAENDHSPPKLGGQKMGGEGSIIDPEVLSNITPLTPQGEPAPVDEVDQGGGASLPKRESPRPKTLESRAGEVLAYLNERTGRTGSRMIRPGESFSQIKPRLREGATVEQCKKVIDAKYLEWGGDDEMAKHVHPKTLFRKSNFPRYLREAEERVEEDLVLSEKWEASYQRWVASVKKIPDLAKKPPLSRKDYYRFFSGTDAELGWAKRSYSHVAVQVLDWLKNRKQILSAYELRQVKTISALVEALLHKQARYDQRGPYQYAN